MAQLVVAAAGAAVGFMVGGPMGAKIGWVAGSMIGSSFSPTQKSEGPRLDDLKVSTSSYGTPIPYVAGHPRVSGQIVWASAKREIATTESAGKGGGGSEYTSYTYEVDLLYEVSDNVIGGVARVWNNGELISTDGLSSAWSRMTVYSGAADQLPDPDYEAVVGTANAPAYRGRGTVFIKSLQLGGSGQIPNLTFEISTSAINISGDFSTVCAIPNTGSEQIRFPFFDTESTIITYDSQWDSSYTNSNVTCSTTDVASGVTTILSTFSVGLHSIKSGDGDTGNPYVVAMAGYGGSAYADNGAYVYSDQIRVFTGTGGTSWNVTLNYATEKLVNPIPFLGTENLYLASINAGEDIGGHSVARIAYGSSSVAQIVTLPELTNYFATSILLMSDGLYVCYYLDANSAKIYKLDPISLAIIELITLPTQTVYGVISRNGPDDLYYARFAGTKSLHRINSDNSLTLVNSNLGGLYVGTTTTSSVVRNGAIWWTYGSSLFKSVHQWYLDGVPLPIVVSDLMLQANCTADQFDVTALSSVKIVRAMAISQVSSARTVLEMLAAAYYFDCVLSDKLYFRPRASASVATLTFDEFGVAVDSNSTADPLPLMMANELEIPAQIAITFSNVDGDYQTDTQYSDRLLTGQESTSATTLPLGFTASEGKQIADALLLDKAVSALTTTVSLNITRAKLEPTDVVVLTGDDGSTYRMRVVKKSESAWVITLGCVADDATVFTQAGVTVGGTSSQTTVLPTPTTTLELLDIPLLRDADNLPGHYVAVKGSASNWSNCALYESADDVTYTQNTTISGSAVMGQCTTTLAIWAGGNFSDEINTLTVSVGAGELSSVTHEQMISNTATNAALVGGEIIQFREATLVSAGVYTLRGLLRGRSGTEGTAHTAAERFVLLGTSGLRFIPQQTSDIGSLIYYKAPTAGQRLSAVTAESMTLEANVLKPLAPVNVRTTVSADGTLITWDRRTRLSESWLAGTLPLGEATESYIVKIYNGATLIRTITSTTSSASYTKAMQVIDSPPGTVTYTVAQVSATVGEGHSASISGPTGYIATAQISSAAMGGTFQSGKVIGVSLNLLRVAYTTTAGDATLGGVATSLAAAVNAACAVAPTSYPWTATVDSNAMLVSGPMGYAFTFDASLSSNVSLSLQTRQLAAPANSGSRRMIYGVIAPPGGSGTLSSPPIGTVFSVSVHNSIIYKTYSYTTTYYTEDVVALAGAIMNGLLTAFTASGDQDRYGYSLQVDNRVAMPGLLFTGPLGAAGWAMEITCSSPTIGSTISQVSPEAQPVIPVDQPQIDLAMVYGTVASGQAFSIVLNGTPYTYTATGADTTQTVAQALATAIGGAAFTVTTPESNMPTNNGYFFYITRSVGNVAFTSSCSVSNSTMTITTTTVQNAS